MSARPRRHVIVGGGLAGATAAATLRAEGFDGEIVLVGEERHAPYERPELSKGFLRHETDADALSVHPEAFYAEHGIDLRTGRSAVAVEVAERVVVLDDATRLDYDALLLATGATPRRPATTGVTLDGVRTLRTLGDAEALRRALASVPPVVVVGGGWIGCEVAASARRLGCAVTLITGGGRPLERVLGPHLSAFYGAVHREHGVAVLEESLVEILGAGQVTGVRTETGRHVPCGVVVLGVGVVPRVTLARAAGLIATDAGIAADARLACAPGVFAAGDVVLHDHPRYGPLRSEHWDNAREQGRAAALSMLGAGGAYDRLPYFFSDQFDVGMEYVGHVSGGERVVVRGDVGPRPFIAFWIKDGAIAAAMNVNVWDVADELRGLIAARAPVDERRLADPGVPLADAVREQT